MNEEKKALRAEKRKAAEERRAKRPKIVNFLLDYIVPVVIAVIFALLFVKFVAQRSLVDGSSMYPTLSDQDNICLDKITYAFRNPNRFEIVVFELKEDPGTNYIKRVIGLPGETVEIRSGYVYINGELLESDTYGREVMKSAAGVPLNRAPVTLGENEFFVLGDNRNNSRDSRAIGPVLKSQILGRALFRFWPLNSMKGLLP